MTDPWWPLILSPDYDVAFEIMDERDWHPVGTVVCLPLPNGDQVQYKKDQSGEWIPEFQLFDPEPFKVLYHRGGHWSLT